MATTDSQQATQTSTASEGSITGNDTFSAGATLTSQLNFISDGMNFYYWTGAFDKVVPAGSTPEDTGGIGDGAWKVAGDAAIRANLGSSEGAFLSGYKLRTVGARLDDEVSVLDYGASDQFGSAMMAAIDDVMNRGGGSIFVPGGQYVLDTSIIKTLTTNVSIRMSSGAYVRVDSPMDVFNINAGDYRFVLRDGIFAANWSAGIEHDAAILRIEASTLKRTCIVEHVTGETLSGQYFKYAVYGNTVNDSEFNFIHFNGPYPIWLTATKSGASAHAMTNNINFCKFYGATVGITIVNDAVLGCEGTKIHFCDILAQTGVQVIATSALGSGYLPPEFDIIGGHINAYVALNIQSISRFKMIGVDVQSKHRTDDGVLGICQFYSCQSVDIVSANKFTSVSLSDAPATERKTQVYLGKYNSLVTARVYIGGNDFWLDGMTNPLISMNDPSDVSGLYFDVNKRSTAGPIILRAYKDRIRIYDDVDLTAYDVNEGLAENSSHSFNSGTGILIITKPPHGHYVRVSATTLPSGSTINQVVVNNMYGEDITIDFEAAEILFTHGGNLICPDAVSTKAWLPCRVVFRMINNQQSKVVSISGIAAKHNRNAPPASSSASGVVGDEYFDGTYYYKYFIGYGWRRTEFTTW